MRTLIVNKEHVEEYIPHRGSMVLTDGLLDGSNGAVSYSIYTVGQSFFLNDAGQFTTEGLIENIAQSHALKDGVFSSGRTHNSIFYLVGIQDMTVDIHPRIGDVLITKIEDIEANEIMSIVKGFVNLNGRQIVRGVLKLCKYR